MAEEVKEAVREAAIERKIIQQPEFQSPEVPEVEDLEPTFEAPEIKSTGEEIDFDQFTDPFSDKKALKAPAVSDQYLAELKEGTTGVARTESAAKTVHLDSVKDMENKQEKGLVQQGGIPVFQTYKSLQGADSIHSEFEIGYGVRVLKSWLTDDRSKWPVIKDVPTDIRKGITKEQANQLTKDLLGLAYVSSAKKLQSWEDMTGMEKAFWSDLTYNGGTKAITRNPKALAAEKKGFTVEGMIKTFDYVKSAGKKHRGLLNRRLSMYNQAALELSGTPVIESYEIKDSTVEVTFAYGFMTPKISDKMKKSINGNENKYSFKAKMDSKKGVYKAKQHKF